MNNKQILIRMMREVHEISVKTSLDYYLAYGSLIGAIREGGMIPWDDEIDITVKSDSYQDFISTIKNNLSDEFEVLDKTTEGYELYFARIAPKKVNHHLCHIDIFPLVGTPNNEKDITRFVRKSIFYNKLYYLKKMNYKQLYKDRPKRKVQAKIIRFLTFAIPIELIEEKLNKLFYKYESRQSKFLYTFGGSYGCKEVYSSENYEKKILVPFENIEVYVPLKYDLILKQVYGDYTTPRKEDYLLK